MTAFSPLSAAGRRPWWPRPGRPLCQAMPSIPCTSCQYCVKGCPQGIPIPGVFSAMNTHACLRQHSSGAKGNYGFATRGRAARPATASQCGQCESVCPQHISIIQQLQQAAEVLE